MIAVLILGFVLGIVYHKFVFEKSPKDYRYVLKGDPTQTVYVMNKVVKEKWSDNIEFEYIELIKQKDA